MFIHSTTKQTLTLLCGICLLLLSCNEDKKGKKEKTDEVIATMASDSLTITSYQDGKMAYRFTTPKLVRYENADTAYMIFDKGIHVVTFRDSTAEPYTWLTANHAIYREKIQLWEVKGNVIAKDKEGKTLYTELLFWDQRIERIYSPIETKVITGTESTIGKNGFESNQDMSDILFRNASGRFLVDTMTTTPTTDPTNNNPGVVMPPPPPPLYPNRPVIIQGGDK